MNRIDPADTAEIALFADSLSIPVEELLAAIQKVGPMRPALRFYVTRNATVARRGKAREPSARSMATARPFQPSISSVMSP